MPGTDETNTGDSTDGNGSTENAASTITVKPSESKSPNASETSGDSELSIQEQIQKGIDEALKPLKEKVDKAYSERDEALVKIKEHEERLRKEELERLEAEGKHKEAYEARLRDEEAKRQALEKQNIELTRDIEVKNELSKYEFRNQNARNMAFRDISGDLVRNDKGVWVHKDGDSVENIVKAYVESAENSFLLKPKVSSGSGTEIIETNNSSGGNKSLFDLPQSEVLNMAAKGNLRKR